MAFGAYQRGNFLYALLEAERRLDANPKDTAAITLIGEIYRDGAAVARNELEASRWFRLASNLGDPQAAYELGVMLVQGVNGVTKDPAGAKAQFERAAAKNHPGALYNLGVMALQGLDGKTPDYNQAAQYFLRAANAGDDDAAYSYGVMLRDGKGAPQDIAEVDSLAQARGRRRHHRRPSRIRHHAVQRRGRKKGRSRGGQDPSHRRVPRQPDRPEPDRSSLPQRRSAAARHGQGRRLEQFRQGGRTERRRPRCRHGQSDPRRAAAASPRWSTNSPAFDAKRVAGGGRFRRPSQRSAFFLRVFPPETG